MLVSDWEFEGVWLSPQGLGGVSLEFMLGGGLVYWYFFGDDVTVDAVLGDNFLFVEGDGEILFSVVFLGIFYWVSTWMCSYLVFLVYYRY